jgi:hypothetical protein
VRDYGEYSDREVTPLCAYLEPEWAEIHAQKAKEASSDYHSSNKVKGRFLAPMPAGTNPYDPEFSRHVEPHDPDYAVVELEVFQTLEEFLKAKPTLLRPL